MGYALGAGFAFASFFVFVSASSFVLIDLAKLTPVAYAASYAVIAAGYGVGAFISARIVDNLGLDKTIAVGIVVGILGGAVLGLVPFAFDLSVYTFAAPMTVVSIGVGMVFSNCQTGAIADFPKMAGAASSTSGFITLLVAGLAGAITIQFYNETQTALILGIIGCIVLTACAYYFLVWPRRETEPAD